MTQKKRLALLSFVGAGTAVMVGLAFATPQRSTDVRKAAIDLMSMMQARSPGDRVGAVTTKPVKVALATSSMLGDSEAASGDVAPQSAPSGGGSSSSLPIAAAPAPLVASTFASSAASSGPALAPAVLSAGPGASAAIPAAAVAGGLPAGAAFGALPIIPALFGGGGGGSPAAVSAVPEPATWLMMIMGFGIMGSALRRRRRFDVRGFGAAATRRPLSSVGIS